MLCQRDKICIDLKIFLRFFKSTYIPWTVHGTDNISHDNHDYTNCTIISYFVLSQFANGFVLPLFLILMLVIINDKDIMRKYVNGRLANYISWATVIIVIALSIALLITNI